MPRPPLRRPGPAARAAAAGLLLAVAVVLAGCRADARVAVDVADDGSGTVTTTVDLDRAAAEQLGDPARVSLDDLAAAGWQVRAARPRPDGGLRWELRRPFGSPRDLRRVLTEVGGTDGVFRGVRLTLDDGFGGTTYRFRTRVRLTGELSQFSDPDLAAALGGVPVGWTPEELAAAGAGDGAARLTVSVRLPGGRPTTDGRVVDGAGTWRFPLSGGTPTDEVLSSSAATGSALPALLLAGGAALAVAGLVVGAVAVARRR